MLERIFGKPKVSTNLVERVIRIEKLLDGQDEEPDHSNWGYRDIRKIIDRTDLIPSMTNQELMNIAPSYQRIERLLEELGQTDMHTGHKNLKNRLDIIEGCISILHMSHLGHTNTADAEFEEMHGFRPSTLSGDILQRVDGIQKKLDKMSKLFENTEVTMSGKTALQL